MTFFFPPRAGAEPVGRGAGRRPRRVQIRARGLHLLPHHHGPTARAERAAPAGLLVRPGACLETPQPPAKSLGTNVFGWPCKRRMGRRTGCPGARGPRGVEPRPQDRFLLEDARGKRWLDGAGMAPLWHRLPKQLVLSRSDPGLPPRGQSPGAASVFQRKAFLL